MLLNKNCRYFTGDRPCKFHKIDGRKCDDCRDYVPIEFKILIIKLDAIGDVLRTTSILPPLNKKYPNVHITWCTRLNAKDIFFNNEFVSDLIFVEEDAFYRINTEEYDIVINLDTGKFSSSIASIANGKQKFGFILNKKGYVEPTSESAERWLQMSAFDDVKKGNKKSYQQIMYEILDLDSIIRPPVINLSDSVLKKISSMANGWGVKKNLHTIGLNIGVGTKWPSKGWPIKRWEELISILEKKSFNLLLLSGPEEKEMADYLSGKFKSVINTGHKNSIMEFSGIVNLCDILITADTLALHIGTALSKKIVALFGPTSVNEIELYGKGVKLFASDECKCYYKKECTQPVSCMEKITVDMVNEAIKNLL